MKTTSSSSIYPFVKKHGFYLLGISKRKHIFSQREREWSKQVDSFGSIKNGCALIKRLTGGMNKYEKLLKVLEEIKKDLSNEAFIFDRNDFIQSIPDEIVYKSEFICVLTKIKLDKTLKEIGEL